MRLDHRAVWRWHFYAGLFCTPFVVVLAMSGSVYLFKPQLDAWSDRAYDERVAGDPGTTAQAQVQAAVATVPQTSLDAYELPETQHAAARVLLRDADGRKLRVYVDRSSAKVLGVVREEDLPSQFVRSLHGELLVGDGGSIVVELAASWAIVMIVTGLYLWWPRGTAGLGGLLYPRVRRGSRIFLRDLHAVTGLWISAFALFLLITALPWTTVWGGGFKELRRVTGTAVVRQDWSQSRSAERAGHVHDSAAGGSAGNIDGAALDRVAARAASLRWAAPVLIAPPSRGHSTWTIRSDSQNRPLRQTMILDASGTTVVDHVVFSDRHIIDRIVGVGIAAHEGQLFAPLNQVLGVLTAAGLVTLCISAVVMWWRRRPVGSLGAPASLGDARPSRVLTVLVIAFCIVLPVLGASIAAVALFEQLVLRRLGPARGWLGLSAPGGVES